MADGNGFSPYCSMFVDKGGDVVVMDTAKVEKASRSAPVVVLGAGVYSDQFVVNTKDRTYLEYASVYEENVWVFSCIRAIATAGAALPLRIYKKSTEWAEEDQATASSVKRLLKRIKRKITKQVDKDRWVEVPDDFPAIKLFENPNPSMSGTDLMIAILTYLELAGDEFIEVARAAKSLVPKELYPMRPDRITIVPDSKGRGVKEYTFQVDSRSEKIPFPADDVIMFKYFSPTKDWRGQATILAATTTILLEQYIESYEKGFFKNGAIISGIIKPSNPDIRIDEASMRRLKQEFIDANTGTSNYFALAAFPSEVSYEPISPNPKDMQMDLLKRMTREQILSAFGVPPVMVQLLEHAKYDNYKLQMQAFFRGVMRPKMRIISSELTRFVNKEFGGDGQEYWVEFDFEEFLGEDETLKAERFFKFFQMGAVSPNDVVETFGLGEPYEGGETHFVSPGFTPIELMDSALAARANMLSSATQEVGNNINSLLGEREEELTPDEREAAQEDEAAEVDNKG